MYENTSYQRLYLFLANVRFLGDILLSNFTLSTLIAVVLFRSNSVVALRKGLLFSGKVKSQGVKFGVNLI